MYNICKYLQYFKTFYFFLNQIFALFNSYLFIFVREIIALLSVFIKHGV